MSSPSPSPVSSQAVASVGASRVTPAEQTEWFKKEVHAHDGQLKAWLRSQFPAVRDVEDIAQESYLRIWKTRAAQPIRSAKAFLFRIARHLAIDSLRSRKKFDDEGYGLEVLRVLDSGPNAADALLTQELLDQLIDALAALPPRYRDALVLHKLKGLSQRETAEKLNLTEGTVQKNVSLGLDRLGEEMNRRGFSSFLGAR